MDATHGMRRRAASLAALVTLALAACDDGAGDGGGGGAGGGSGGLEAEVCEHMTEGPFQDVMAAASADDAPSIDFPHRRIDIALVDGTDGKEGYVSFPVAEAGEYLFYLSDDVPLQVTDIAGAEIAIEESGAVPSCAAAAVRHRVELAVGTVTLRIGPTDRDTVGLVFERDDEHGHEHEHEHEHDDHDD